MKGLLLPNHLKGGVYMSKKKRNHKVILEIGKFYRVLDGSPGGHHGQIFKIDYGDKTYHAIITGSMSKEEFSKNGMRKGYFKLKHATDNRVDISLIRKRPFIGDRNDYGEKEYEDMSFNKEDMFLIVKVQNGTPIFGAYYKKRKKIKKPQ